MAKDCTKEGDCEYKVILRNLKCCCAPQSIDCHYAEPPDEREHRRFTAEVFACGAE